jgi:uncharacterized protein with NRDE domain
MCLIAFKWNSHPDYKLILTANRDEFYARPSERIHFWDSDSQILAGKDKKDGGTWMGITKTGRFAALTNYRDPSSINPHAPSRGQLVYEYLAGELQPGKYAERVARSGSDYNGFNLLIGDKDNMYYLSNYKKEIEHLSPGLYGLSNHLLDTPWPKVRDLKDRLDETTKVKFKSEDLFSILMDSTIYPDEQLPHTGVPIFWERAISAMFIRKNNEYGTVNSTILTISTDNQVTYAEQVHGPDFEGKEERLFEFNIH